MAGVVPGISNYEIAHITLYKVHQRVARTFKLGRTCLIGDAAHINNPLGGMGMNGGIHDAVNLATRLAAVWRGEAPDSRARSLRQAAAAGHARNHPEGRRSEQEEFEIGRVEFRDSLRSIAAEPGAHPRLFDARVND